MTPREEIQAIRKRDRAAVAWCLARPSLAPHLNRAAVALESKRVRFDPTAPATPWEVKAWVVHYFHELAAMGTPWTRGTNTATALQVLVQHLEDRANPPPTVKVHP
ncbi:MAG: hypothetical protein WCO19_01970 [Candidatus Saccharibacteria bacterium]